MTTVPVRPGEFIKHELGRVFAGDLPAAIRVEPVGNAIRLWLPVAACIRIPLVSTTR